MTMELVNIVPVEIWGVIASFTPTTFVVNKFHIKELDDQHDRAVKAELEYWKFTRYYDTIRNRIGISRVRFYVSRNHEDCRYGPCCVCGQVERISKWTTGIINDMSLTLPPVSAMQTDEMECPMTLSMCASCFERVWSH